MESSTYNYNDTSYDADAARRAEIDRLTSIDTSGFGIETLVFYVMILAYYATDNQLRQLTEEYRDKLKEVEKYNAKKLEARKLLDGDYTEAVNLENVQTMDMDGDGIEDIVVKVDDVYVAFYLDDDKSVKEVFFYDLGELTDSNGKKITNLAQLAKAITNGYKPPESLEDDASGASNPDATPSVGNEPAAVPIRDLDGSVNVTSRLIGQQDGVIDIRVGKSSVKIDFNKDENEILILSGNEGLLVELKEDQGPLTNRIHNAQALDQEWTDNNAWSYDTISNDFTEEAVGPGGEYNEYQGSPPLKEHLRLNLFFKDDKFQAWVETYHPSASSEDYETLYMHYMHAEYGYQLPSDYLTDPSWIDDFAAKDGHLDTHVNTLLSTDQIDMLNIQRLTNQLNFIVTMLTNFLNGTHQARMAVARNLS